MVWNKGTKGVCKPNSSSFKKGQIPWNKGKVGVMSTPWNKGLTGLPARHTTKHSEETKKKMSIIFKERWASGKYKDKKVNPNISEILKNSKIKKGKYNNCIVCNKSFYVFPSRPDRKFCSNTCQGKYLCLDKHHNWQGGITPLKTRIRRSAEYKKWRKDVFTRDAFTCQCCGVAGVYVEAHHIKPFSQFVDERFDLNNGITLCYKCHRKAHKKEKKNG
jgi:hypothetical protein